MATNTDITTKVAKAISSAIDQSGIKKIALCDKTGMPYSTLNSKLRAYSPFTVPEVYKIAAVLNVPPRSLLEPQSAPTQAVAA